MWFALTFLLSASVISVQSWVPAPGHADPDTTDGTYVHCDAWVPNEKCCHTNFKKYDNDYVFDKYTKAISKRMYSQRVEKPTEVCDDGPGAWYAKCPKDPTDYVKCQKFHSDMDDPTKITMCRKSCGICGTEAIMTTYRKFTEIEKVDPPECWEVSKKYPYKCLKYKMTEPQPMKSIIFANFKLADYTSSDCVNSNSNGGTFYHAKLKYRRRGPADKTLCAYTKCCICQQVENGPNQFMHLNEEGAEPKCEPGTEINIDADLDADLGYWYKFIATFTPETDPATCGLMRRVIITCDNGVDFVDIDGLTVKGGKGVGGDGNVIEAGDDPYFEKYE